MIFKKLLLKKIRQYNTHVGLTGSESIYKSLVDNNIKTVFGYTGGAILSLTDKFYKSHIKYIKNVNELCVGHSAEAFGKISNTPGIVITTSGPGVTNLITPLQNACSDGNPLIVMSGQVSTNDIGTDAFQECPSIDLTKSCTKWSYRPTSVNELPNLLEEAFKVSMSGRKGPVFIDLPKDILLDKITENKIYSYSRNKIKNYSNMEDDVESFFKLLYKSKKPIIYAGQGCTKSYKLVRDFSKLCNIPVTTTIHGMGVFDETDKLSLHMLGMHGSVYANKAIQNSDLIIAIGSRFDDRTTGNLKYYAPKAKIAEKENRGGIVHFDISDKQIDKVVKSTLSLVGDCKIYLKHILKNLNIKKLNNYDKWINYVLKIKKNNPFSYKKPINNKINCQQVIESIYENTKKKDVYFTTGVGNHQMFMAQFYRWKLPNRIITSGSLGTMGFGLPSAIGVQLAKPNNIVCCVDGDGSFMMTQNDLSTIKEYNLPIKIFIMNDNRQQMVYIWQKLFFNEKYISTNNFNPNFNKLADSFGIENLYCDNLIELDTTIKLALEYEGPILVNFKIKPDMCLPLVAPGKALDDMILKDTDNINSTIVPS